MKVYYFEQNTPEWYEIRKLKFTASNANTILAMGTGVKTLIGEMLSEYYSSGVFEEYSAKYQNKNMQRGHDFEDKARLMYQFDTGNKVETVGFIELDEYTGCSPDGLIGEDGLLEIKNPSDIVFLKLIEEDKIDKKHIDQMQFQMFVTNRQWCDYYAFNPNFKIAYRKRILRDEETQTRILEALQNAKALLIQRKDKLDKLLKTA